MLPIPIRFPYCGSLIGSETKYGQHGCATYSQWLRAIVTPQVAWAKSRLADIKREAAAEKDARILPLTYAPVIVFGVTALGRLTTAPERGKPVTPATNIRALGMQVVLATRCHRSRI